MTEQDNTIYEGWASFIENNSERYLEIYEANKDKKVFLHTNWAAFFWLDAWMFYRKMYRWGLLVMVLKYLLAFGAMFAMIGIYLPQLLSAISLGELSPNDPLVEQAVQKTISDILLGKVLFVVVAVALLAHLAFSLLADCLYRQHIRKSIGYQGEGTSVGAVVLAIVASGLFGELVSMVAEALIKLMLGIT